MKKYNGTIMLLAVAFLFLMPVTAYSHELYNSDSYQMNTDLESKTYIQEEVTDYPVIGETITAPAVVSKTADLSVIGNSVDTGFEVGITNNAKKEISGRQPDYSGMT